MKKKIVRRDFIKKATAAVAMPAATQAATSSRASRSRQASAKNKNQIKLDPKLPSRMFGKLGIRLPVFCFGGAQLASKWGNDRGKEGTAKYIQYAYDKGLRYFDTAGNYGTSQSWLGYGVKANKLRDKVFLATKIETTQPQNTRRDVERCLKELETDHIDLLQMHGTPGIENMTVKTAMKIHAELVKLKDEGMIKHIGLTAHSYFDKALEMISSGGFEQCMLALGYFPRGYDQYFSPKMIQLREKCVAKAHSLKMGIVAMKVMGRGTLGLEPYAIAPELTQQEKASIPGAAIRWVLQDKRIHLLVIGLMKEHEIDANIRSMAGKARFSVRDKKLLAKYSKIAMTRPPYKDMRVE